MSPSHYTITLGSPFGTIWKTGRPEVQDSGLLTAVKLPQPDVKFVQCDISSAADTVATITTKGVVHLFHIKQNRYAKLDGYQSAGTAIKCSVRGRSEVYAAFEDGSVRVYSTAQMALLGTLRGPHRTPVRSMSVRSSGEELITVSKDAVILWNLKTLTRSKALGSGPYGALSASYTPGNNSIITPFKDDSFWLWDAATLTLQRKISQPIPQPAQPACRCSAVSLDGQLLVAGGAGPLLFVWSLPTGQLLHAVHLPLAEGVFGTVQLQFLPDNSTVAALGTDGHVRFVDLEAASLTCRVAPVAEQQAFQHMAIDARGNYAAAVTRDGQMHLHDLAMARKQQAGFAQALRKTLRSSLVQASSAAAAAADRCQGPFSPSSQSAKSNGRGSLPSGLPPHPDLLVLPPQGGQLRPPKPVLDGSKIAALGEARHEPWTTGASMHLTQKSKPEVRPGQLFRVARLDPEASMLNERRLQELLLAYGEYPSRYRLMIWEFLLRLPHNSGAHQGLVDRGLHPAFAALEQDCPLQDRSLLRRLSRVLSALAHWAPIFGEVGFLPAASFPFVKLFGADEETCFEVLATLMLNWGRHWFEHFPSPPMHVLGKLEELLSHHDPNLHQLLAPGLQGHAWALLSTLLTEVLPKTDWLKVWDHAFSNEPTFLLFLILSFMIAKRGQLAGCQSAEELDTVFRQTSTTDVNQLIRQAYRLRRDTPSSMLPDPEPLRPLPAEVGHYPVFNAFPRAAVQAQSADRERIAAQEAALVRRRRIVADLELRSNALAQQEKALARERQRLSALEVERRAALRGHEAEMAAEQARLDDRAKEQRLAQVAIVEQSYQKQLQALRQEWTSELKALEQDVEAKRRLATQELSSRAEEETIRALEFQASQRTWQLQQDAHQAAAQAQMKHEIAARQAGIEARRRQQLVQWAAEDEERQLQHSEAEKRRAALAAAEAEAAARKEAQMLLFEKELEHDAELAQVKRERHLRLTAENDAAATAAAVESERIRTLARDAEDAAYLQMKAEADTTWYESEQLRREAAEQALQEEKDAAARLQKQVLYDVRRGAALREKDAQLLERRRQLERQNAEEERASRKVLERLLAERRRHEEVNFEIKLRDEAVKARLEHATQVGSAQQAAEQEERSRMAALAEQVANQAAQREGETRRRHEEAMSQLALAREKQILHLDKAWRQRVMKQELAELAKENTDANRQQTTQELALTRKEHEAAKEVARLSRQTRRLQGELREWVPSSDVQHPGRSTTAEPSASARPAAATEPTGTSGAPAFRSDAAEAPTQQEPVKQSNDAPLDDEAGDTLSSTTSTSVPIGDTSQDTLGTTLSPDVEGT